MSSAFSINHLDVVEARAERALFFMNERRQYFAELRNMCRNAGKLVLKSNST